MHQELHQSSVILRVFAVILTCLFFAVAAMAQEKTTKPNDSTSNGSSDYKKILNDLETLYEREVQKLEQQNNQAKELYRGGLISRVEMEKSDQELAECSR
jgi:hypothetical protein